MLAKYIPGAIWAPAARVVAVRRAGVTDAALVTSSMLLEAGLSAVAGVIVFVVSLPFVDEVNAPLVPLVVFGAVLAVLVQPRVFRPLAHAVLRKFGYTKELPNMRTHTLTMLLVFYAGTWVLGGFALWLLLRSVGAHPEVVVDRLPRRSRGRRRDRRRRLRLRAVGDRRARGLDVRAAARGRHAGTGPRSGRAEPASRSRWSS